MDINQEAFVHDSPGNAQSFLDAVNTIKPTAIIGKELLIFCICVTALPCSNVWNMQKLSKIMNMLLFAMFSISFYSGRRLDQVNCLFNVYLKSSCHGSVCCEAPL